MALEVPTLLIDPLGDPLGEDSLGVALGDALGDVLDDALEVALEVALGDVLGDALGDALAGLDKLLELEVVAVDELILLELLDTTLVDHRGVELLELALAIVEDEEGLGVPWVPLVLPVLEVVEDRVEDSLM